MSMFLDLKLTLVYIQYADPVSSHVDLMALAELGLEGTVPSSRVGIPSREGAFFVFSKVRDHRISIYAVYCISERFWSVTEKLT